MSSVTDVFEKERNRFEEFSKRILDVMDRRAEEIREIESEMGFKASENGHEKPAEAPRRRGRPRKEEKPAGEHGSKSRAIREYLSEHPEASNKEVAEALDVNQPLVYAVRSKLNKGEPRRRGRPPKQEKDQLRRGRPPKQEKDQPRRRGRPPKQEKDQPRRGRPRKTEQEAEGKVPALPVLIPQILSKPQYLEKGLRLDDLVEEALHAGFKSRSTKGRQGVATVIYQTVNSLTKERDGEPAPVVKDRETKAYKINRVA